MNNNITHPVPWGPILKLMCGHICVIVGIIFFFIPNMFIVGLVAMAAGCCCYVSEYKRSCKASDNLNRAFKNLIFDFKTGLLYLENRDSVNGCTLSMSQLKLDSFKHHDATIEFNAATVGGVTVGGFNVNPASESKSTTHSTKYVLMYTDGFSQAEIKEIVLTPELLEIAKQTPEIKNRLTDDGHIRAQNKIDWATQQYIQQSMQMSSALGRNDFAFNAISYKEIARGLSHEEATTIIAWIKGNL